MRVVFMRSNPVQPDPRVEKQANALLREVDSIQILAWNRIIEQNCKSDAELKLSNGTARIKTFNIRASFGVGARNLIPLLQFQLCLLWWLVRHRNEYDVVHACDFDTVIPAWVSSVLYNKKYVYDIFDYYVDAFNVPPMIRPLLEKVDTFMINRATAVIIVSENRREQISRSNPKKLIVIHNSPEEPNCFNDLNVNLNFSTNKLKVGYVGILSEARLLKEIIEVFKEHPEWELHIGGFGPLESYVKEASITSYNIVFYGRIPYKRVLEIEKQCDILFATYDPKIPNHKYSSPNKLYEAMKLGKPIIVVKGTGIDGVVNGLEIGVSIDYSSEDFERAILKLLDCKDQWELYKHRGRALYDKEFSWGVMTNRLLDLYRTM